METTYPDITAKLLELKERDQAMRKNGAWDETVDLENTEELKAIVAQIGWPTISKVGRDASQAAWLVAQHADHEIPLQERWLNIMRQEPESEVLPAQVAFLTDRVRVNRGRSQVYGTQFYTNPSGIYGPHPIEDLPNLDDRRRKVGLGPFEEYRARMIEKKGKKLS